MQIDALIFDMDGTLAETEDLHRRAFNAAFAEAGLNWVWDLELYRDLHSVTGGKERMRAYAARLGVDAAALPDAEIARIHSRKNVLYGEMAARGECPLLPGVERLIAQARARGLRLAICTTTSPENIDALLAAAFGPDARTMFAAIVCGADVKTKKPSPEAYLLVLERLGLPAERCLAFEDSRNGLRSAKAAGLRVVLTPSLFTTHETFEGADLLLRDLRSFDLAAFAG